MRMAAGSIVKLKLKHFMTYDSLEITPCPGLNLVTGPNGTGKSTLLCAMCLGLAGKPSSIGRSERLSDFIKNGFDQAYIEIELLNPEGANIIIERVINSSNNSQWTLNGRPSSQKLVEKEISQFNIQTNNLCQFLPQEKVADFTKMNPRELLESTEQAVGDQSMFDNHMKLKQLRAKACELEGSLNGVKENLEREVEKNKRLEGEVTQHKEREKHIKKIDSLQKKIPWMKYEKARDDYVAKGEDRKMLAEECKKSSAKLEPLKREIGRLSQQLSQAGNVTDSLDKEIRKKKLDRNDIVLKLEAVDCKLSDKKYEINQKIQEERGRNEKLQRLRTVLKSLEAELREAQAEDENNQKQLEIVSENERKVRGELLDAIGGREKSKSKQAALINNMKGIMDCLAKQHSEQEHRFTLLRNKEPDAHKAVQWLRENRKEFKKKIYDPILTLINVPDPQAVKYIENHIAYRDLTAFFAEDPDDMNKFLSILSDNHGLDISGIHSAPVPEDQLRPRLSKDRLRHFGLTNYLMELFTAPAPVMNYLCKSYKLYEIPVGYEYSSNRIKNILANKQFPFTKFFMGDFVYKVKTSKYGNHSKSSSSQKIVDTGLLRGSVDTAKIEALQEKRRLLDISIKDEEELYSDLCQKESNLNAQIEDLRVQKKKLLEKKEAVKKSSARIRSITEQIKIAETPLCDIEEEEKKLLHFMALSIQEKREILCQLNVLLEKVLALEKRKSLECLLHYFLLKRKEEAERALGNASTESQKLERSLQQIRSEITRLKSELQIALNEAKRTIGLSPSDEIPQEVRSQIDEEFCGLPNDVTELESEVAREQAKLNCIYHTNPAVIDEYLKREKLISKTKETVADTEQELKDLEERINHIKDQWLPAIESLIEKVSENFSRYFASLGCAGEVTLDKTDNPNDFLKYGISIKVKFRDDEPLNQLSHAHHSGGECSVSTILFILSLQELTEVPFRCVDEINQGMDNINERSVFDLIVKSSCSKKKSQYFLITPKLLHGLDYPAEMEIAIIHNGSSKRCKWDIAKFLRIRSALGS